jgi:hypothetical protein
MNEGCFGALIFFIPILILLARSGIFGEIFDSILEDEKSSRFSYENFFTNLCKEIGNPAEAIPLSDPWFRKIAGPNAQSELEQIDFLYQKHTIHLEFRKTRKTGNYPLHPVEDQLTALDISQQRTDGPYEILEIRIPLKQKFWLRLNRQKLQEQDADEIQSGVPELDREYLIYTNQADAAVDFLGRMSVRKYLSKFPCSFDQLEIIQGQLTLTINEPRSWEMKPYHLKLLLQNLLAVITEYQEHNIIILHVSATKSEYRCPYCRNAFDENSGPIIQCKNCGTRLHEVCWNENGQCTTWGCRSTIAV